MFEYTLSKSMKLYDNNVKAYGYTLTDIDAFTKNHKANVLRESRHTLRDWDRGCVFDSLREGVLAYVQKGRNPTMTNPFVISNIKKNSKMISVNFKALRERSHDVELIFHFSNEFHKRATKKPVDIRKASTHITAKDTSHSYLADNGSFYPVPDIKIATEFGLDEELLLHL